MSETGALHAVIRKLGAISRLDEPDRAAIASLPHTIKTCPAGTYLIREGKAAEHFYALVDGYAYRSKSTKAGRSQILSFHMVGDLFDLAQLLNVGGDTNVVTLGHAKVAEIPLDSLRDLRMKRPGVGDALWRDSLLDAAIFKEWVVNVGQRDSATRIAHMLAEFAVRRAQAKPNDVGRFTLPINQLHIGAATGLTSVHVNRMLKLLEEQGALSRYNGHVVIGDQTDLARIAGFEPEYLQPTPLPT